MEKQQAEHKEALRLCKEQHVAELEVGTAPSLPSFAVLYSAVPLLYSPRSGCILVFPSWHYT